MARNQLYHYHLDHRWSPCLFFIQTIEISKPGIRPPGDARGLSWGNPWRDRFYYWAVYRLTLLLVILDVAGRELSGVARNPFYGMKQVIDPEVSLKLREPWVEPRNGGGRWRDPARGAHSFRPRL